MVEAMINEAMIFRQFQKKFHSLTAEVIQYLMLKETTTVLLTKCIKIIIFVEKESNIIMLLQLWIKKQRLKKGNSSLPSLITCLNTCFRLLLHEIQSVNITFYDEIFEKLKQAVLYNHQYQLYLYSSE